MAQMHAPQRPDRRRWLAQMAALGTLGGTAWSQFAHAAGFPSQSIDILAGAAPGGPTDFLARIYAELAGKALGQAAVVENKPGGSGVIAATEFLKRARDGHHLMAAGASTIVSVPLTRTDLKFDAAKDFVPLGMLGAGGFVMVARKDLGVNTVEDFVALARKRDKPLNMGTGGKAAQGYFCGMSFAQKLGLQFTAVHYQGDAKAFADVLGGQIDVQFTSPNLPAPHVGTGNVKILAVTSKERLKAFPDTPTLSEKVIPGFEYLGWIVLFALAGTPPEAQAALRKVWSDGLANPDVQARLDKLGMMTPPAYRDPSTLPAFIQAETDRIRALIKQYGV